MTINPIITSMWQNYLCFNSHSFKIKSLIKIFLNQVYLTENEYFKISSINFKYLTYNQHSFFLTLK
jgi:hypothetical protein